MLQVLVKHWAVCLSPKDVCLARLPVKGYLPRMLSASEAKSNACGLSTVAPVDYRS